jgi:hypothetical protein
MPERPVKITGALLLRAAAILLLLVCLSLALAWISTGFKEIQNWGSFFLSVVLATGLLAGGWLALRNEALPRPLALLMVGAALLRLALGVFWYTSLPSTGYASQAELRGYVMADAYDRDRAAFELARSEKPLWQAFQGSYHRADQYGGLLFFSAWLYRYAGGSTHQPLMIVVIASAFSALSVIFLWAFSRRGWNEQTAWIAAWGIAVYPEAVLLGSSQMREAFIITLVMTAFYGLVYYWREHSWPGLIWIFASLALILPFSPPAAGLLMAALAVLGLAIGKELLGLRITRSRWLWIILGVLFLLIVIGIWLSWKQIAPEGTANPLELMRWWIKKSAEWQAHLSERASGKIQAIFDRTPAWAHLPMLLAYGVAQPFLPATLIDVTAAAIWRGINIWRSLGWTVLLALLLYAPLLAWRRKGDQRLARGLTIVVWMVILVASYRSGADLWDNPRYRAMFAGPAIALAAWAWVQYRLTADAWLRRALVGIGLVLAWFLPWYLMRYVHLPWPVTDEIKVLGLGIATALLYCIWDWAGSQKGPPPPG